MNNEVRENRDGYTPATIVKESTNGKELFFSIPLYQRLFEWSEPQVRELLQDLYRAYEKDKNQPYYIGMLTAFENNGQYDLVDGQQRFTVMMLLAIVLKKYYEEWNNFFYNNNNLRLKFYAREEDTEYIEKLSSKIDEIKNEDGYCNISSKIDEIKNEDGYCNSNMLEGIKCINTFFESDVEDKLAFSKYIYNNLTFFISLLPQEYKLRDLNKYFETMNSLGRPLENHEILKVRVLKKLAGDENVEKYTKLWNIISDMDKPLLREESNENNDRAGGKSGLKEKFSNFIENFFSENNLLQEDDEEEPTNQSTTNQSTTIGGVEPSSKKPEEKENMEDDSSLFSFSIFLLFVLYTTLEKNKVIKKSDFFDEGKLLSTFDEYLLNEDENKIQNFIKYLLYYRLILEIFFIRRAKSVDGAERYELKYYSDEKTESEDKKRVEQFLSMLYVSTEKSNYYKWVVPVFEYFKDDNKINQSLNDYLGKLKEIYRNIDISLNDYLDKLKEIDRNNHPVVEKDFLEKLKYGVVDRYWFWRLDYELWENREKYFDGEALNVANNYLFKRNRSIEHIAPQTPKRQSNIKWDENDDILHTFGNLAMISASQNSSLQNESFEVKKAHVESYIKKEINGSIESLKMLKIYQKESWDKEAIKEHEEEMIRILKDACVMPSVETLRGYFDKLKDEMPSEIKNKLENFVEKKDYYRPTVHKIWGRVGIDFHTEKIDKTPIWQPIGLFAGVLYDFKDHQIEPLVEGSPDLVIIVDINYNNKEEYNAFIKGGRAKAIEDGIKNTDFDLLLHKDLKNKYRFLILRKSLKGVIGDKVNFDEQYLAIKKELLKGISLVLEADKSL